MQVGHSHGVVVHVNRVIAQQIETLQLPLKQDKIIVRPALFPQPLPQGLQRIDVYPHAHQAEARPGLLA